MPKVILRALLPRFLSARGKFLASNTGVNTGGRLVVGRRGDTRIPAIIRDDCRRSTRARKLVPLSRRVAPEHCGAFCSTPSKEHDEVRVRRAGAGVIRQTSIFLLLACCSQQVAPRFSGPSATSHQCLLPMTTSSYSYRFLDPTATR